MTRVTTTFQLSVVPAPTTVAAQIAASLSSGEWSSTTAQYLGVSTSPTINDLIGSNGEGLVSGPMGPGAMPAYFTINTPGNTQDLLFFTGASQWVDQRGGEVWYSAGPTGWEGGSQTMIRYSLTSDTFAHWQGLTVTDGRVFPPDWSASHNHEGACTNGSKIFRFLAYNSDLNAEKRDALGIWDTAAFTGTVVRRPDTGYQAIYPAIEFCEELGPAGSVVFLYNRSLASPVHVFDVGSNNWGTTLSQTVFIQTDGSATCQYGGKAYFTDGTTGRGFFRIGSTDGVTGAVETRANTPVRVTKGYLAPSSGVDLNKGLLVPLGNYIYLLHETNGSIYRYDPVADDWNGGVPVGSIPTTDFGGYRVKYATAAPIESLGVIMLVQQTGSAPNYSVSAQLWKP